MSEHSAKIVAYYKSQSQELQEKTPSRTNNNKKKAHQLILHSKCRNQRELLKNNFGNEKNL